MDNQTARSSKEIRQEITRLEALFKEVHERETADARKQIESIMREYNLRPDQIFETASKKAPGPKSGNKVEPQWKNADGSKTWSGRGRRPGWVDTEGERIVKE